jgi:uncharacterized repeat protein (TIGR03803 family)
MKSFTQMMITGIFFLILTTGINAQEMWGMTSKGGEYDMGVIFKTDADGSNYTVVKSLSKGYPGQLPGRIVSDGNDNLYGYTERGGKYDLGVIFKYDYITLEYVILYNFGEKNEGYKPDINSIVLSDNNKLYGYSMKSNDYDYGLLFKFDLANNIYSEVFTFAAGSPIGTLTLGSNGDIYGCQKSSGGWDGTTYNSDGWLFGIHTNSDIVFTLHVFDDDAEGCPNAGVTEHDGVLYGTTDFVGSSIYKYVLSTSTFSVLKQFNSDDHTLDPEYFEGTLVYKNNRLYGIKSSGAQFDEGAVYEYNLATGAYSFVMEFDESYGEEPVGNLILGNDGFLYGTTHRGGAYWHGVFYKLGVNGTTGYQVLKSYTDESFIGDDWLVESGNGGDIYMSRESDENPEIKNKMYGSLSVYIPTLTGNKFKVLYYNTKYETGYTPKGSLAVNRDKTLTGFTSEGGNAGMGTKFDYDNTNSYLIYSDLNSVSEFNGKITIIPRDITDDEFSLAKFGGDNDKGAIYSFVWGLAYSFDGTSGAYPNGSIIMAANGKLYGMTSEGGTNDKGVVFEYDYPASPRVFTKLVDFDGTSGANPQGSFIEASDGKLYATTKNGGANNMGTIIYYNPATGSLIRHFDKVIDFNGTNGKFPMGDLVEAEDGILYGLTSEGGTNDCGTLFEYDLNSGILTVRYNFSSTWGKNPKGSLTIGTDGRLFGLTNSGGTNNKGVMFSFDPATSTYHRLVDFDGTNGANPVYTTLLYTGITPDVANLPDVRVDCAYNTDTPPTATNTYGENITATTTITFPMTEQGTYVITWNYEDERGNVASQEQTIIIADTRAPAPNVVNLPDIRRDCSVEDPMRNSPKANDNCKGEFYGTADVTFPITAKGTTVITWTFDDDNGNITTQTQKAIVGIDNTVTVDGSGVLTASATGGYTYQWYACTQPRSTLIEGATAQSYTAKTAGGYKVKISNSTCYSYSICYDSSVSTGIEDVKDQYGISIYPNPTNGVINIENTNSSDLVISVYDVAGNKIEVVNTGNLNTKINLSSYVKGIYFVVINTGNDIFSQKIIRK